MKTIEEGIHHCIRCLKYLSNYPPYEPTSVEHGFIQGVAFAEEWIRVEDELPIFDKNKLISGEQDLYLVKMSVGSISPKTTYKISFLVKEDRWNCECDWNVVTHWRPINRK